jgi:signal transduction histidine kinase/ActR/RegA family two-component response regulator
LRHHRIEARQGEYVAETLKLRETVGTAPGAAPRPSAAFPSLRLLALLCIALPVMVYAAVGAYRYAHIRAETEVRLDRSLRVAEEHALKVLDTNATVLDRVLDTLGSDDAAAVRAREKVLHEQLKAMSRNRPQLQSIWVHGPDGRPLATDRAYPVSGEPSVAGRADFLRHRAGATGLDISEPVAGPAAGGRSFRISRGRRLPDGSFAGVASVSLPQSYFEKLHADLVADEPGLAITMLREDGAILSRWPVLAVAPPRLAPSSPVMTRIAAGQSAGTAHGVSSVDGNQRLLAFTKVGDYPIYVGTGMAVDEILRRWLTEMAWFAAFGLPPMLGLFLAARIALRRTTDALQSAERLSEETHARRRVEEALLQAQKLEALGRLTGGVAHDFNNALMVISSNLFLLKRKHPEVADGAQASSIGRAVASATQLTRQLLAFSRRQALVVEHMTLQERLPQLTGLLGPVLGSQVELTIEPGEDTRAILVDSAELELAIVNLAINARDAMPNGGRFRLVARNAGSGLPPTLSGDMVVIEASDTGSGIEPAILDKVFEPFFTTKPVGKGTGLGLSQIYGLCQRAGGLATISSEVGVGTTVCLYFPAARQQPGADAPPAAVSQRPLHKRILLVEDNDEVATALQQILETLGCSVVRFAEATSARDWLTAQAAVPDVLLTDVVMPGPMDGLGLAQHVRQHHPGIVIVIMTGYAEQIETISLQGFHIVPKPCSEELLADAILRAGAANGAGPGPAAGAPIAGPR